jgi:hypothetical protein
MDIERLEAVLVRMKYLYEEMIEEVRRLREMDSAQDDSLGRYQVAIHEVLRNKNQTISELKKSLQKENVRHSGVF